MFQHDEIKYEKNFYSGEFVLLVAQITESNSWTFRAIIQATFISVTGLLAGCGNGSETSDPLSAEKGYDINSIQEKYPDYCGGAKPEPRLAYLSELLPDNDVLDAMYAPDEDRLRLYPLIKGKCDNSGCTEYIFENGALAEWNSGTQPVRQVKAYGYDPDGRTKNIHHWVNGELKNYFTLTYNGAGQLIETHSTDFTGHRIVNEIQEYKYNESGQLTRINVGRINQNLEREFDSYQEFTYCENGNLFLHSFNHYPEGSSEPNIYVYKYDEFGFPSSQVRLDKGYIESENRFYFYNEFGALTHEQVDLEGGAYNVDGVIDLEIVYSIDSNNNRTGSAHYYSDGITYFSGIFSYIY